MPLKPGKSNAVVSGNIAELHHGNTYAKTAEKHGKKTAQRQAIAIAMKKAGRSRKQREELKRRGPG